MQEGVQKLSFYGVYVFNWELNTGCDCTGEIRRPEIIMSFQCWSKILVASNLKMIAR
jgi:hypothetical protein